MTASTIPFNADQITVQKSIKLRYSHAASFGLTAVYCFYRVPRLIELNNAGRPAAMPLLVMFLLFCGLCSLLALISAGPSEAVFDPHARTYTLKAGAPLIAKTLHGPLEDIRELQFKVIKVAYPLPKAIGGAPAFYIIRVEWNDPKRKSIKIGFMPQDEGDAVMSEIQNRLSVPARWVA